jgi:hypothetical protein
MKKLIIIISFLLSVFGVYSQQYFQQEVNYIIDVSLNDINNSLTGAINIEYINNSPDTLKYLYFHLYPNAYSNTKTAFCKQKLLLNDTKFYYSKEEDKGYIDSLYFTINNIAVKIKHTNNDDVIILELNKELKPGDSININTPFYVKIPAVFSRLSHENNSYNITQWYPKPAVYDINGWHPMPYLDMGEFYSEFGRFEVNITVPDEYVVAATGVLQNKNELLRYHTMSKTNCFLPNADSTKTKTLTYIQNNVHDFAWFADKNFKIKKEEVFIEGQGDVSCYVFYRNENKHYWQNATKYITTALLHYSELLGPYPYDVCTAVDGVFEIGGGMEYPTITIVASTGSHSYMHRLILHEVGHNWFYGILASNERAKPWIDEGFNSYYEERFFSENSPEQNLAQSFMGENRFLGLENLPSHYDRYLTYAIVKNAGLSQAPNLHSENFLPENYMIMCYQKPVVAIQHLENYLTKEVFDSIMREFYSKYKFKHIYPEDIKQHFYTSSNKNTDWFFDELIESDNAIDYKIVKMRGDSVLIKNNKKSIAPLLLTNNDETFTIEGFEKKKWINIPFPEKDIIIDKYYHTTELNRNNNLYRPQQVFPKLNQLKISILNIIDLPNRNELGIFPALAYNYSQKIMFGAAFYSSLLPQKRFEYQIVPFIAPFSFKNNNTAWSGTANLNYNFLINNQDLRVLSLFSKTRKYAFSILHSETSQTHAWYSQETGVEAFLPENSSHKLTRFNIKALHLLTYTDLSKFNHFIVLRGEYHRHSVLNPIMGNINLEHTPGGIKAHFENYFTINYMSKKKGLHIRVFGGKFLYIPENAVGNYNFRLSGNVGAQDYLYSNSFINRGANIRTMPESFGAHQFIKNEGGFASYTPYGQTNDWLLSANLYTDLPIPFIKVFANYGLWSVNINNVTEQISYKEIQQAWEVGIELQIVKDISSIYFPIIVSQNIKETNELYFENYWQKIRFTLYLSRLNIFDYRNKTYLLY